MRIAFKTRVSSTVPVLGNRAVFISSEAKHPNQFASEILSIQNSGRRNP